MYGSGVNKVHIVHRSGKTNTNADALSRNPLSHFPDSTGAMGEGEVQVAAVKSKDRDSQDISTLLNRSVMASGEEQQELSFLTSSGRMLIYHH